MMMLMITKMIAINDDNDINNDDDNDDGDDDVDADDDEDYDDDDDDDADYADLDDCLNNVFYNADYDDNCLFNDLHSVTDDCGGVLKAFASDGSPENITGFQTIIPGSTCGGLIGASDTDGTVLTHFFRQNVLKSVTITTTSHKRHGDSNHC